MKKIIFVLMSVVIASLAVICQSKENKLKSEIKTELKKEAKLSGLSVKFNKIDVIECDTIPTEFNGLYLKWSQNAIDYYELSTKSFEKAKMFIGLSNSIADEYRYEGEKYGKMALYWDSCATEEYKSHNQPCYIVYSDYVVKGGASPIRVTDIKMYKWKESSNKFDCCYTSLEEPKSRFERYK